MTKVDLEKEFLKRFNKEPERIFFCPGRVNLIGEHIDYNGGQVMPCAISSGTWLLISKNTEKVLRFQCINFPEVGEFHLQSSYSKTGKEWFNYPLGMIHQLLEENHSLSGMDMLFYGNLPIGAGLSSSASIEVLMGYACSEMFKLDISRVNIALLGKKTENEFIGVNSGIMDQFAVAMGKKDRAILLNCDTLNYQYIPFEIGNYVLAIINSNKQRALAESKYNERFAECGAALKLLKKGIAATHLCDISAAEFESHRHLINNEVLEKRALHVVTENERVKLASVALADGQIQRFGELMYASHQSLKELYEVSGKELDTIVDFSKTYKDCIGARMTGAGFGGCAIALVKKESFDDYAAKLTAYYNDKIGYKTEVFASDIGEGVMSL
ncbi:MAG: galactokinase [Chitinophagaceae bacterium]